MVVKPKREKQYDALRETLLEHVGEEHTLYGWKMLVNQKLPPTYRFCGVHRLAAYLRVLKKTLKISRRMVSVQVEGKSLTKQYIISRGERR